MPFVDMKPFVQRPLREFRWKIICRSSIGRRFFGEMAFRIVSMERRPLNKIRAFSYLD